MENRDILFQVAVKLDNETLGKLLYPQFWESIKYILSDANFWYERSMYLTNRLLQERQLTDWKKIYRTLDHTLTMMEDERFAPDNAIWYCLDYLPSVKVLEEIFGSPDWSIEDQEQVWMQISDPEAMNYLLDREYLELAFIGTCFCLEEAATRGYNQMIEPLFELMKDMEECQVDVEEHYAFEALINAIVAGHIDTMKLLIKHHQIPVYDRPSEMLAAAMRGGHRYMILYIFDNHISIHEEAAYVARDAIINTGSIVGLEVSMDRCESPLELEAIYESAIEGWHIDLVGYMLDRKLVSEDNLLMQLKRAVSLGLSTPVRHYLTRVDRVDNSLIFDWLFSGQNRGTYVLEILLSDSRMDLMPVLRDLLIELDIYASIEVDTMDITLILASSDRMKVEEMDIPTFNLFLKLLDKNEYQMMNEDSIYSLVLRFLTIKSPTSSKLMDWMIAMNNRQLQLAANVTVPLQQNASPSEIALRALMLSILYPTLRSEDIIDDLEDEGVRRCDLLLAQELVELHRKNLEANSW